MKHFTPGPWKRTVSDSVVGPSGYLIASVFDGLPATKIDRDLFQANAALISAAPDLLAALQSVGDILDGYCWCHLKSSNCNTSECVAARRAIAKAEGEEI